MLGLLPVISVPSGAVLAAVAAGGGHLTPTLGVLTALGSRQFQIPSYDARQAYVLSNGSASLNSGTGVVTLPSGTSQSNVTCYGQKGIPAVNVRTIYRMDITYTSPVNHYGEPYVHYSPDNPAVGTWYDTDQWNPQDGSPAGYYGVFGDFLYTSYDGEDSPPSGYSKVGGEWVKSV